MLLLAVIAPPVLAPPALATAIDPKAPRERPAMEKKFQRQDLLFQDPAERRLYDGLRAWIAGASQGFRHVPLRVLGNFVQERWCGPEVPEPACAGGAVVNETRRGAAWRTLETLHYPDRWPQVFGVIVSVGEIPRSGAMGVRLHLSTGGGSITGDGLSLAFLRLDADGVAETLLAGDGYSLDFPDHQTVRLEAPGGGRAELGRLRADSTSLERTLKARMEALEARALTVLEQGGIHGFDEDPYEGRGVPPLRTPRPLRPEERAELRARAQAEIARRCAFIRSQAAAMHGALGRVPAALLATPVP